MGVRDDCRHYLHRGTPTGEAVQRCRIAANTEGPFACPDGCLFFEERQVTGVGWTQSGTTPMSNTADGLIDLPPSRRRRKPKRG